MVLAKLNNNVHDAQDAAWRAFAQAYKYLPKFRGDSSFHTWLFTVATNEANSIITRRKRKKEPPTVPIDSLVGADGRSFSDTVADPFAQSPLDSLIKGERMKVLKSACAKLSPMHKKFMDLYLQGLSHDQISEILKISTATSRTRLYYAKEELAKLIAGKI